MPISMSSVILRDMSSENSQVGGHDNGCENIDTIPTSKKILSTPAGKISEAGGENTNTMTGTHIESSMRTPAISVFKDSNTSSTMVNNVTPFDNFDKNSENSHQIHLSSRYTEQNSAVVAQSVSRRGGRFVSPGQRQCANSETTADGESNNNNSNNTTISGNPSNDETECSKSSFVQVREYKTYRSPTRTRINDSTEASDNKSSNAANNIPKPEADDYATKPLHTTSLSGHSIEQINGNGLAKSGNLLSSSVTHSIVKAEEESQPQQNIHPKNIDERQIESLSLNDSLKTNMNKTATPMRKHHDPNPFERDYDEEKKATKDVYSGVPCRSPPPDSTFLLEEAKTPDRALWLTPKNHSPKSHSKPDGGGRDYYMATPTDFLTGKDDPKINHQTKCPDTAASYDSKSSVLAWLQSPSGLFSPGGFAPSMNNTPLRKTPRTPLVSTSFFFSDVASLPRNPNNSAVAESTLCNNSTNNADAKNESNNNVICVSPMLVDPRGNNRTQGDATHTKSHHCDNHHNNSLTSTPAAITGSTPMLDFHNVFASPQDTSSTSATIRSLPLLLNDDYDQHTDDEDDEMMRKRSKLRFSNHLHHLPPRVLSQRSSSSSKLDHLADHDVMEDEAPNILIRLASNNNPDTPRSTSSIFRSSPIILDRPSRNNPRFDNGDHEDDEFASKLQIPLAVSLSHRRHSAPCSNSKNVDFVPPPLLGMRSNSSSVGSKEIYAGSRQHHVSIKKEGTDGDTYLTQDTKENIVDGSTSNSSVTGAGSTSYPMHCLYSVAMSYHGIPAPAPTYSSGAPHLQMTIGGQGAGALPASSSSSSSTGGPVPSSANGPYGEYSSMPSYPPPYNQYNPHSSHHHLVGGYTPYQQPQYVPSSGQHNNNGNLHYVETPSKNNKQPDNSSFASSGRKGGKNNSTKASQANNNNKRGSPSEINTNVGSSSKKKKVSSKSPNAPKVGNDTDVSPSKGSSKKSKSTKSTSLKPIDRQKAASNIAAVNLASGGKNDEAAALAAAILRGVTMRPSGKWQAQLYFAGKSRYIGVFESREKAALAYEIAREKLKNGENSILGGDQNKNATTENLVNAARKAAFDGVSGGK